MTTTTDSSESTAADASDSSDPPKPNPDPNDPNTKPMAAPITSIPLPPKDAGTYEDKQPGHTRGSLKKLVLAAADPTTATIANGITQQQQNAVASPTASDSDWGTGSGSAPSTRPPSQAPSRVQSRAPSMSAGAAGGKLDPPAKNTTNNNTTTPAKPSSTSVPPSPIVIAATPSSASHTNTSFFGSNASTLRPKAPSVKSASSVKDGKDGGGGGGHKFNLKDLLPSTPKLSRKGSQRSTTSSRHSDSESIHDRDFKSDGGDGGKGSAKGGSKSGSNYAKSNAGDSTVSLTQKYGVCQKLAIGKGATSVVRLAHKWDRTADEEKLYAVKEFRKRRKNESSKEYIKKLTAEFCISSTLHHTNIVETVDLVQDENHNWCEVMEFCPGGDLYAAIKKGGMSPSEVECCFKQILLGVGYLHSQGVAHRDIKPENLFFDARGHLKIGDYGASTVYRLPWEVTIHMSTGLCGSEPYIAPEQFLGKPYDARLVDIWACGIVYYCLHFQELPWRAAQATDPMYSAYAAACAAQPAPAPPNTNSKSDANTTSANGSHPERSERSHGSHTSTAPTFPQTITNLSPRACRSLIRRMLEPNPKERASIEEVVNHVWVGGIEVCYEVEKPRHVHVNARAVAGVVERERGRD